jgi:molybdopterin-containing oxidoreductase family iron-sulfur binding subunit
VCSDACHRAHNVPTIPDRSREVKWIWKAPFKKVFPESEYVAIKDVDVPVFCNHCANPSCVRVCPTGATWKREDGIVMMDWHRCIGCRYCVAACPYGSRSFNWVDPRPHVKALRGDFPTRTTGVVEKCNLCEERLAKGEPPACVAVCPEQALLFGNLRDPGSPVRAALAARPGWRRRPELGTEPAVFYLL